MTSKNADTILKQVKVAENRNMNNEATIEGLDKNLKEANKMKRDSEYKLEELSRRLGVLEVQHINMKHRNTIKSFYL